MCIKVIQASGDAETASPANKNTNPLIELTDVDQPQRLRRPHFPRSMTLALGDASRALPISDAVRDAMQPADPQGALGKCIPTH